MKINDESVVEIVDEFGVVDYNYFACICDPKNEEYWKLALQEYTESCETDPVSMLIMDLHHNYHATVESIGCDLWFGISLNAGTGHWNVSKGEFEIEKECRLFIQCDEISHGLLAATMILKELGYDQDE